MATWPPGEAGAPFPQGPYLGLRVYYENAASYFQVGIGPGKVRRRGTRAREFHSTPIELTGYQLTVFNEWFETTLLHGTLPFTWVNMLTGEEATYRFKEAVRPEFTLVSPAKNFATSPNESGGEVQRHYTGTIDLELLP